MSDLLSRSSDKKNVFTSQSFLNSFSKIRFSPCDHTNTTKYNFSKPPKSCEKRCWCHSMRHMAIHILLTTKLDTLQLTQTKKKPKVCSFIFEFWSNVLMGITQYMDTYFGEFVPALCAITFVISNYFYYFEHVSNWIFKQMNARRTCEFIYYL